MEFAASAEDVARAFHGHPTLNEAVKEAALAIPARRFISGGDAGRALAALSARGCTRCYLQAVRNSYARSADKIPSPLQERAGN